MIPNCHLVLYTARNSVCVSVCVKAMVKEAVWGDMDVHVTVKDTKTIRSPAVTNENFG